MNPITHEGGGLVDQDHALDSYFEALLHEQLPSDPDTTGQGMAQGAAHGNTAATEAGGVASSVPPDPGEQTLDAVIFTVDGLRLALPAVKLARIVDLPAEIHPVQGRQPWHMGRCVVDQHDIDIVDPAEIVIPPSHRVRSSDARRHDVCHLLLIAGTPWALACQAVETAVLDRAQIHWRTEHTRRQWLAGTVMSHGCGLLDVDGLLRQLSAP